MSSHVDASLVVESFEKFRADAGEQFRLAVRRRRVEQLRALLIAPLTVESFDAEVWAYESETTAHGQPITGRLFRTGEALDDEVIGLYRPALDTGALELHGNYVWSSASSGLAAGAPEEERTALVAKIVTTLSDPALTPLEKTRRLSKEYRLRLEDASGLVMLVHPDSFLRWSAVARSVFAQLGEEIRELEQLQQSATALAGQLGSVDLLELDAFVTLLAQGRYGDVFSTPETRDPSSVVVLKIAPGEGARYWKECVENGYICVGWDGLGDLRNFHDFASLRTAVAQTYGAGHKTNSPEHTRLARDLTLLRDLRVGDRVVANRGKKEILAVGVVTSRGYEYLHERREFKHVVYVTWDLSCAKKVPEQPWLRTIVELKPAVFAGLMGESVESPAAVASIAVPEQAPPASFAQILEAINAEGLRLDARTVRRYHVGLQVRGFVILAGISGTGKTWLTRAYADASGAAYQMVPVAPNWTSNEDLLGYFNPLSKTFADTPVSQFLREAGTEYQKAIEAHRTPRPYHLVLDEMNLALL